ncbi:cytochrome c oxidase assembly protein [Herbiconiux sp. SYSU D00978]|uniref:cytochrome c oxidase assembly protein n=1 Tax=Herbiconiux sp. SYSU D00978 TaxID=2812562 RepID=UPI001A95B7FB|nr:cytochrome c oxidase assembly protein [Herbiconiux sp. SYSU D00978]
MPRTLRVAGPAALLAAALLALVLALGYGGGAAPLALLDPGPVVRWGLPAAKLVVNLGAALAIGALLLTCFAFRRDSPAYNRSLDLAAAGAGLWTVAATATAFFTFLSIYAVPVTLDERFGAQLSTFFTTIELGQAWLATILIAAGVTVLCFAVRNQTALAFVFGFAVIGLVPMARQGHAGGTENHDEAVSALLLHLIFAAVWLGGLLVILLVRKQLAEGELGRVLTRYSTVALVSFVVVAISGYVSAAIRVGGFDGLGTEYGVLVLVKVAALGALGLFGLVHRRVLIDRIVRGDEGRPFWLFVVAELAFMGIASGVASALARTAPPVDEVAATDQTAPTPAELLTGEALPPELTTARYFTEWRIDLVWLLLTAFLAFFYVAAVVRLHRRGDRWPLRRTLPWLAGLALLAYVTNGGVNVYESYLFSVHMLAHMLLTMAVPLLLVLGAPITLGLRAIRKREDGTRGGREWLLLFVHSKFAAVLTNPIVAAVIWAGSLWLFYYSPLFRWATTDHLGHQWMIVHFLLSGFLFAQALVGIDPLPYRAPYPLRLVLLLATMAFHAFFGLALMQGTGLLLADWYGAMGRDWGLSALADQQAGGGIAWSIGEIPTLAMAVLVAVQWSRSDARETKRLDRQAERTNDAELNEYNEMLARMQKTPTSRR